ncbi:hypothetical protein LTR62_000380 [Meristemomyces frigidus]|uniref:C2H2-type domain-containing protein n=1 Tax=Meristemomyces frigidus TaxID=1508187 RepID=A0AAN7YQW0_9PEZI|nr:hypothetical protein LTR62_000380 [Meristemomyces frigidus]
MSDSLVTLPYLYTGIETSDEQQESMATYCSSNADFDIFGTTFDVDELLLNDSWESVIRLEPAEYSSAVYRSHATNTFLPSMDTYLPSSLDGPLSWSPDITHSGGLSATLSTPWNPTFDEPLDTHMTARALYPDVMPSDQARNGSGALQETTIATTTLSDGQTLKRDRQLQIPRVSRRPATARSPTKWTEEGAGSSDDSTYSDDEAKFACSLCRLSFPTYYTLERHARITGHKAYECPECYNSYNRRDVYVRHSKTHRECGLFVCKICETASTRKRFKRKDHLQQHIRTMHHGMDVETAIGQTLTPANLRCKPLSRPSSPATRLRETYDGLRNVRKHSR